MSGYVTVAIIEQPFRFPGQYYDSETGLHYNLMRDYDPRLGRYVQSDPIGLAGGISTYGYAGQNPVMAYDPSGELFFLAFLGPLLGMSATTSLAFDLMIAFSLLAAVNNANIVLMNSDGYLDSDVIMFPGVEVKCQEDCPLTDADFRSTVGDKDENGVTNLAKEVTCYYTCPSLGITVSRTHFIAPEMAFLISSKQQAMNWCPKSITQTFTRI